MRNLKFPALAVLSLALAACAVGPDYVRPTLATPEAFARELELQGKGIVESALEACRLRLRPIVMTSVAFIAGTVPLVLSHGAGAEIRSVTGITVFAGMLGVTLFGLFLTPVFYVALRKMVGTQLVSHGDHHNASEKVHA